MVNTQELQGSWNRLKGQVKNSLWAALLLGVAGCTEQWGVQEKTKITGPEGKTTITKDTKVESSGKNPPIAVDPVSPKTTTPTPRNP